MGHDLLLATQLWVMDESALRFRIGWQLASGDIFETFDDGRLAGAICPDDESEWSVELDGLRTNVVERAHARDLKLVD